MNASTCFPSFHTLSGSLRSLNDAYFSQDLPKTNWKYPNFLLKTPPKEPIGFQILTVSHECPMFSATPTSKSADTHAIAPIRLT